MCCRLRGREVVSAVVATATLMLRFIFMFPINTICVITEQVQIRLIANKTCQHNKNYLFAHYIIVLFHSSYVAVVHTCIWEYIGAFKKKNTYPNEPTNEFVIIL